MIDMNAHPELFGLGEDIDDSVLNEQLINSYFNR
jgi:hypothetical protein